MPGTIPSVPIISNAGTFAGSTTGSLLRPSYESTYSVTAGLKSTSFPNLLRRHSM